MSVIPLLLGAVVATATPSFGFERVDVIAPLPGTFINDDLPRLTLDPLTITVRWLEQVQVVFTVPVEGLTAGVSLSAQSLFYAVPLFDVPGLELQVGLQTRLLLPAGFSAGLGWRWWRLRVGLGVVAGTEASWDNIDYDHPYVMPTLSLGIGRLFQGS